jgi:hypothetical protein
MAKKCIVQRYEDGGLRMTDLENLFASLKITWLRRLFHSNTSSKWKALLFSIMPGVENIFLIGDIFTKVLVNNCNKMFWKDVFETVYKLRKIVDIHISDSIVQPNWYSV